MASPASGRPAFGAKQLVFACLLVAVVSVLAFAMGVVVGRDAPHAAGDAAGRTAPPPDAPPDPPRLVIAGEPEEEPTAGALEEVTYPDRLGSAGPQDETLRGLPVYALGVPSRTPEPGPAPAAAAAAAPEAVARAADEPGGAAPAAAPPPESDPYTVQVAALRSPGAAEDFAGRLRERGFPAYVVEPAPDGPAAMYRVRVGQYADRGAAERVLRRLAQEEQLKPWITR